jgi:tellurite resistance protein TehA-like permease
MTFPPSLSSTSHNRIMAHDHSIDKLTAVWLLPVVAPIVAGATGGNLCAVIPQDSPALNHTLVASYILWGIGIPFAMSILVLYIHRLTVYKVSLPSSPPFRVPLHSFPSFASQDLTNSYPQQKSSSQHSSPSVP